MVKRETFNYPPIKEVAFEIRFDTKLAIDRSIAEFQEMIMESFPVYAEELEIPIPLPEGIPEGLRTQLAAKGYIFDNKEKTRTIRVTSSNFIFVVKDYHNFDEYKNTLIKYAAVFCKVNKITKFNRIGLRYINNLEIIPQNGTFDFTEYVNPRVQMEKSELKELITFIYEMRLNKISKKFSLREGLIGESTKKENSMKVGLYVLDLDCYIDSESESSRLKESVEEFHDIIEEQFLARVSDKYKNYMRTGTQ